MFYDSYLRLCNARGKAPSAVAQEIGLEKSTVTRWKHGGSPTDATAERVAAYFGVSLGALLEGRAEAPGAHTGPDGGQAGEIAKYLEFVRDNPEYRMMFDLCGSATLEEIKATVAFLRTLREQNRDDG